MAAKKITDFAIGTVAPTQLIPVVTDPGGTPVNEAIAVSQLVAAVVALVGNGRGTFAARPTAGVAGRIYICTDSPISFIDDGSTWRPFRANGHIVAPPAAAGYTQINAGGRATTLSDLKGGLLVSATNGVAAVDKRLAVKSIPSAPYDYQVHAYPLVQNANHSWFGVCLRNSTSGSTVIWGFGMNTGAYQGLIRRYTANNNGVSPTFTQSGGDVLLATNPPATLGDGLWLGILDDNTNRHFRLSIDGINWLTLLSESRTTHITPDQIGVFVAPNVAASGSTPIATAYFDSISH